jgi:Zn-dependent protease with chaperone function
LAGTGLAIVGLLVFLVVLLAPENVMAAFGLTCLHGDICHFLLPLWAQFAIWLPLLAALGGLLGSAGWTLLSAQRWSTTMRKMTAMYGQSTRCLPDADGWRHAPVCEVRDEQAIACVVGVFRPFILVSTALRESLSTKEFEAVLAHERAHVSGHHNLLLLAGRVSAKMLFFSPGVRTAEKGLYRSVEMAADASAAKQTGNRLLVASSLTRVAGLVLEPGIVSAPAWGPVALAVGDGQLVARRVRRLLADDRQSSRLRRPLLGLTALALAFLLFTSGMVTFAGSSMSLSSQTGTCVHTSSP